MASDVVEVTQAENPMLEVLGVVLGSLVGPNPDPELVERIRTNLDALRDRYLTEDDQHGLAVIDALKRVVPPIIPPE